MKELLYATNNPGKLKEVSRLLEPHRIKVWSPKSLGIDFEVNEVGNTLEENARLKFDSFSEIGLGMVVMSDDTGVEIAPLRGEPGIHVRRWKDHQTRMSDEGIIRYCIQRLEGIPFQQRKARFRTIVCLGTQPQDSEFFEGVLDGLILEQPIPQRIEGFPFESLFYIPEINKVLGRVHQLRPEQRSGFLTHRERAIRAALPRMVQLLNSGATSD